jgi:hypothetical protein
MAGMSANSYGSGNYDIEGESSFVIGALYGIAWGKWDFEFEAFLSGDSGSWEEYYFSGGLHKAEFSGLSLMIPVIVKYEFKLGPVAVQPLAGLYFNFALGNLEYKGFGGDEDLDWEKPLLGLMFGADAGIDLGRGRVFVDLRFAGDLGDTVIDNDIKMGKTVFMMTLGYRYFLGKK